MSPERLSGLTTGLVPASVHVSSGSFHSWAPVQVFPTRPPRTLLLEHSEWAGPQPVSSRLCERSVWPWSPHWKRAEFGRQL